MLDFTRLMLISTQVEVVVEVGVELGNKVEPRPCLTMYLFHRKTESKKVIFPLLMNNTPQQLNKYLTAGR